MGERKRVNQRNELVLAGDFTSRHKKSAESLIACRSSFRCGVNAVQVRDATVCQLPLHPAEASAEAHGSFLALACGCACVSQHGLTVWASRWALNRCHRGAANAPPSAAGLRAPLCSKSAQDPFTDVGVGLGSFARPLCRPLGGGSCVDPSLALGLRRCASSLTLATKRACDRAIVSPTISRLTLPALRLGTARAVKGLIDQARCRVVLHSPTGAGLLNAQLGSARRCSAFRV